MDIVAHRGASGHAPENTHAAFRLAWQQGADGVELDVHMSADGRVMVHHDANTRRCTGRRLVIAATHSAELRSLDAGAWKGDAFRGEPIPFLEEVLVEVPPGRQVLIEIKCGPEIVPSLERALGALPGGARASAIAFNAQVLRECRRHWPKLPLLWVLEAHGSEADWDGVSTAVVDRARAWGFDGLDLNFRTVTPGLVQTAREAGLQLACWTVNRVRDGRRMQDLGLDAVTTDFPAELRSGLTFE